MNQFHQMAKKMVAAHNSWEKAVSDLTLEHVNHHERSGVLPISFTLMHLVNTEDFRMCERITGQDPLWVTGGWAERVGVNVPAVFRGTPLEIAETLRFANIDAWRLYQSATFAQTQQLLTDANAERWEETFLDAVPPAMYGGYLHLLVGEGPVSLGNYLEVVLYHHSLRHLGELEHARSLVGLTGVGG